MGRTDFALQTVNFSIHFISMDTEVLTCEHPNFSYLPNNPLALNNMRYMKNMGIAMVKQCWNTPKLRVWDVPGYKTKILWK
jgi:hypothetical protein